MVYTWLFFQDNIVKAKSDFADFRTSFEFDTDGKGLKELVELWQKKKFNELKGL